MTMFKLTLNQILIKIPTKLSFNQNNKERKKESVHVTGKSMRDNTLSTY